MSAMGWVSAFGAEWQRLVDESAKDDAADAKRIARNGVEGVRELTAQVDRLQMLCEAMWTILKKHTNTTDDALWNLVREIDLRDGKLDGKCDVKGIVDCTKCGRAVSVRTGVCLYCGDRSRSAKF